MSNENSQIIIKLRGLKHHLLATSKYKTLPGHFSRCKNLKNTGFSRPWTCQSIFKILVFVNLEPTNQTLKILVFLDLEPPNQFLR